MTRDINSQSSSTSTSSGGESSSTELKLYQTFIFTVPIFFIFILLFFFYLFYLRRRRVDWDSLRMRVSWEGNTDLSGLESGLKKEVREMLPIIVYKESFSVRDTQCPVCLSDYQPEDRLQQIPGCGHTFHMECIDSWLSNHATCPICRLSLLPSAKIRSKSVDNRREDIQESSEAGHSGETSARLESSEGSQHTSVVQLRNEESGTVQSNTEGEAKSSISADQLRESVSSRNNTEDHENKRDISASG